LALLLALAGMLLSGGTACRHHAGGPGDAATASMPPSSLNDPCVERLDELSRHLLLYYTAYDDLPATLNELVAASDLPPAILSCPVSGKPYVYDPAGIYIPNQQVTFFPDRTDVPRRPEWLIVYDSEPVHEGYHWGIVARAPASGWTLSTDVIAVEPRVLRRALIQRATEQE
jgi:hypothetical protein